MGGKSYTPGPWTTDAEVDDQAVIGPDGVMVADCAIFVSPKFGKRTDATNTANARLISAAPDLLAALKQLLSIAEDEGVVGDDTTIPACRAVIAKAEGRS